MSAVFDVYIHYKYMYIYSQFASAVSPSRTAPHISNTQEFRFSRWLQDHFHSFRFSCAKMGERLT